MHIRTNFPSAIRRNWGYWDGQADRAAGRPGPAWAKSHQFRPKHPFDKPYGEGYWIGFYNEPAPAGAREV